jgi:hypothetical protein
MKRPSTEAKRSVRGRYRPFFLTFIAYDQPVWPYSIECIIDDGGEREIFYIDLSAIHHTPLSRGKGGSNAAKKDQQRDGWRKSARRLHGEGVAR